MKERNTEKTGEGQGRGREIDVRGGTGKRDTHEKERINEERSMKRERVEQNRERWEREEENRMTYKYAKRESVGAGRYTRGKESDLHT